MLNWRDPMNPKSGGAERVTLAYWKELASRGHRADWFACGFPHCESEETVDGVRVIRGASSSLVSRWDAYRWARRHGPFDLIVDQHHGLPWWTPWWAATPRVSYIHEVLGPIWRSFYPWPISAIGQGVERLTHWAYRNERFWTGCDATRRQLERRGIRRIDVVSYGVDTVALSALPEKELSEPLRLITVCRLAPNKRVDHVIRTVARLRERGVAVQLDIVGSGDEERGLKKLASQLEVSDACEFVGRLSEEDKLARMRRAHFLTHTSVREGWGLNVVEANAMGTPAAVYPVPGLTESTQSQVTGWVSDRETPESLADGLQHAIAHPELYQQWRRNALASARALHWDVVAPTAADWLESVAREGSKRGGLRYDARAD